MAKFQDMNNELALGFFLQLLIDESVHSRGKDFQSVCNLALARRVLFLCHQVYFANDGFCGHFLGLLFSR